MTQQQLIIHIDWDGPYSLDQINSLTDNKTEKGVYQVYGTHPVYGKDVLLYIGKTGGQTFGKRILQEKWDNTNNYGDIKIHVGRLAGSVTPSNDIWLQEIDLAERLLIYAHKPAFNSMSLQTVPHHDLCNVHILNWGLFNQLMPEVSGLRWTNILDSMPNYEVYGEH
ncbi:hypothetical protein FPZ45_02510 [Cohnella terricola]|uniref:GIY-YIG domain-containing protein n=1 Tax=Cohnella terricola TaxID=1289167 RepID=A0A559JX60_9BACL|nr:hypothetical protein FPZ45_02510 [Cohnella terricola]